MGEYKAILSGHNKDWPVALVQNWCPDVYERLELLGTYFNFRLTAQLD